MTTSIAARRLSLLFAAASVLIASSAPALSVEPSIEVSIAPGRQAQLKYLLAQDCGSCHGMTRKGGLGPALLPDNLAGKPDQLLVATILDGRTGTAMPPWRGQLTEAEAAWLVQQLRRGVE
ncbi:MAG: cytochrome c [Gammaproteobacteria bacterium]|nr:cytochrome c [Gammaproteobacteria bacterium]